MNNRWKEFVVDCSDPRLDGVQFDREKFASAIVDKCISLCEDQGVFLLRFSQFGSNAAYDCADVIKSYFYDKEEK
jgi:hypothetical protein